MSMPELPCWLECPECKHREWCSKEDPDAGFSVLWNHVQRHATERAGSQAEARMLMIGLMAKVAVVPDA